MWEPIPVSSGELNGLVLGVTLPRPGWPIGVWTDRGYYTLRYGRSVRITRTPDQRPSQVNPAAGTLYLRAFAARAELYGRWEVGGEVRTRLPEDLPAHPAGESVEPDPDADALVVYDPTGAVRQRLPDFPHRSGSWAVAGFGPDGRVLMVADPRGVRLFEFVPVRGREKGRWQAAGSRADRDALYAAILAAPDDDTPRLVYADWLDEHGDPARAEFIRLQCSADQSRYRTGDLNHPCASRWVAELPAVPGVRWSSFVRGFPQVWVGSGATLARAADVVWSASPVEQVTVGVLTPNSFRRLGECPYLARVRHLILSDAHARPAGPEALEELLGSPHLGGLRRLEGQGWGLDDRSLGRIAGCRGLAGLEELALSRVSNAGALEVARSLILTGLRRVDFPRWMLGEEARAALRARFPDQTW